ncbi:signal peptidase I [Saxibacter everestensis]|uniref:Signal peptidase I n=1 Tax=Saxibacter everestensis TaxID=2909229 RepID=A0ABY8QVR9_9MICO|nr:signal peptidase I [Brevibacteriaceae bacterium ZFBP1038]
MSILLAALIRGFLVQTYSIPSDSMEPTLSVGDQIVVWRPAYTISGPERGDIVVFDGRGTFIPDEEVPTGLAALGSEVGSWFGLTNRNAYVVKRVIGVGGDRITCCTDGGKLVVNGEPLDEPYVQNGDVPSERDFDVTVPEGRLWLMGDHRSDSADSRAHLGDPGGGMLPAGRVVGKVTGIVLPPARFGTVKHGS